MLEGLKIFDRRPLREMIYETLRGEILRGEIRSGERLIEERIANRIGASRTPVREALQRIEQEGLISKLPKGGFEVNRLTPRDIEEIFGIRSVLESYAAYLATGRMTKEALSKLDRVIEDQETCLNTGDLDTFIALNTEFHEIIYKASGSRKLHEMILNLRDYLYRYRRMILNIEGMPELSLKDHKKMLALMRQGKAKQVEPLVRRHILVGQQKLLSEIRKGRISL